jgi:hypothetical protein
MHKHLQKRLVSDPLATGDLTCFCQIGLGQAQGDLHAAGTAQFTYETRSLVLVRGSLERLLFEELSSLRTCPQFGFIVFALELRSLRHSFLGLFITSFSFGGTITRRRVRSVSP